MYPPPVRFAPKFNRYLGKLEGLNKLELVFDDRIEDGFNGAEAILDNKLLE